MKNITTVPLMVLLLVLFVPSHQAAEDDDRSKRREATEKELSKLQIKIKELQTNQKKNRSSLTIEQQALKKTDLLVGKSRKALNSINRKLRKSKARLKALNTQRNRLNNDKKSQQKSLREQIRAAHAGGKQEYLKLLFNQEDPSQVGRTLVYYDYLNKARLEKIKELNLTLQKLSQVEIEIIKEQSELQQLANQQQQENNRLNGLKDNRQIAIAQLNNSLKSNSKRLAEWQANEEDLKSLLDALKQSAATLIPEESLDGLDHLKGRLTLPVKGRVKEKFGSRRGDQQMRWSGVLIASKEGRRVNAIHHGRVVYSDYLRGFGLISIIDHGEGYMSLYGHNEALYKQPGDWVEAGEQIATVGKSGGYPSSGLYFEIRYRSKAMNPMHFVNRK